MNRRGFFGRIGTLIAGAFAAKVVAPKLKLWPNDSEPTTWLAQDGSVPLHVTMIQHGAYLKTHDGARIIDMQKIGDRLLVFSETSIYDISNAR